MRTEPMATGWRGRLLDRFAKLLGIRPDQAEDALRSERAAKHVVSRRSFFGAAAALSAGATVYAFAGEAKADQLAEFGKPGLPIPDSRWRMHSVTGCVSPLFLPVASGIDIFPYHDYPPMPKLGGR